MLKYKLKQLIAEKQFAERGQVTLLEISQVTGINRMTLSKIANRPGANVTTDNLDRLCAYFQCSVSDLVEYIPDAAPTAVARTPKTKAD